MYGYDFDSESQVPLLVSDLINLSDLNYRVDTSSTQDLLRFGSSRFPPASLGKE